MNLDYSIDNIKFYKLILHKTLTLIYYENIVGTDREKEGRGRHLGNIPDLPYKEVKSNIKSYAHLIPFYSFLPIIPLWCQ